MKRARGGKLPWYPAAGPQFSPGRRRVLQGLVAAGTLALTPREAPGQSSRTLGVEARHEATVQASVALLGLPRQALIVGNSKYKESPLKNPANDANAMGEALRRMGFNVALLLDAGRDQMQNAIQAFGEAVAKRNAVGLFYFAGHGVQLAWRNYLIPVDAVVDNPDDVRERTIELNTLLQGLTRAKNSMNVIILDACRDNPFGTKVPIGQKGLSQFDAPPGSLLAYATAPGNVASDGEGANGLYTENLLREMRVPEAKIEDIFKRVRLHVRRRTHGQQIPWESTSLEEDFYFVLPRALAALAEEEAERERKRQQELAALERQRIAEEAERNRKRELALIEAQRVVEEAERKRKEEQALREAKLAEEEADRKYKQELALQEKQRAQEEAERRRKQQPAPAGKPDAARVERQFEEELAIWEKIKSSKEPGPLEDYLLRYPSGRYSELAQLQLDRVLAAQGEKRIEIVSAAENPYSQGTAMAGTRYRVGDSYTYRVTDLYTKLEVETFTQTITKITDTEVIYNTGMVTDLLGNQVRTRDGRVFGPAQFLPLEFAVGKRWNTRFKLTHPRFGAGQIELEMRVIARETITVPAGTFDAFRLEGHGWSSGSWGSTQVTRIAWIAPDRVRRWIVSEDFRKSGLKVISSEREELLAYKQS